MRLGRGSRVVVWALLTTGLASLASVAAHLLLTRDQSALVFILAVFLAAATGGLGVGIATALLSSLAYDFFFLTPVFSLSLADPEEVFALSAFLCMAVLTGSLAGRLREETDIARRKSTTLQSLYEVVGQLSEARSLDPLLETAIGQIAAAAGGSAVLLRPEADGLVARASAPGPVTLDTADREAARLAAWSRRSVPAVAPGWPGAQMEFRPLVLRNRAVAVIGFAPLLRTQAAWREADQALTALFHQITLAAERIAAEEDGAEARTMAEQERLRSALLSSISHDLRTPLATILGSITSLRQLGDAMPASDRNELMAAIEEETERLSRFVANLLYMTRLEAGLELRREWIDTADVVRAAVRRSRILFPSRMVVTSLAPETPPIHADSALLEQVLFNLIENALRYAPQDKPVEVAMQRSASTLTLTVTDDGPGIPAAELTRVFEKFHRGPQADRHPGGAGLGLAICRGIVTALGGTIVAESPVLAERGTRIRVDLPCGSPEQTLSASTLRSDT